MRTERFARLLCLAGLTMGLQGADDYRDKIQEIRAKAVGVHVQIAGGTSGVRQPARGSIRDAQTGKIIGVITLFSNGMVEWPAAPWREAAAAGACVSEQGATYTVLPLDPVRYPVRIEWEAPLDPRLAARIQGMMGNGGDVCGRAVGIVSGSRVVPLRLRYQPSGLPGRSVPRQLPPPVQLWALTYLRKPPSKGARLVYTISLRTRPWTW